MYNFCKYNSHAVTQKNTNENVNWLLSFEPYASGWIQEAFGFVFSIR